MRFAERAEIGIVLLTVYRATTAETRLERTGLRVFRSANC